MTNTNTGPFRRFKRAITWRRLFVFFAVTAVIGIIGGGVATAFVVRNLPSPDELSTRRVVESTKIFDRTGNVLLYEIHGEEKRTVIPFQEIPANVRNATIAIEDAGFYQHAGIDLRGVLRALIVDIRAGEILQGGSTITQQLVKKVFFTDEQLITRKIKEIILALAIEAKFSKEEILNLYLNQIPYGSNAYGIEAAAQTFFGKHASALSASEAALLAALPRAPSYYSPYGSHPDDLLARRDLVLRRMYELGYINENEYQSAKAEKPDLLPPQEKGIRAPHFTLYVRDLLVEKYGEEEVEQGGLIVTTTLDWPLQEKAEAVASTTAARNEQLIKAANMALVAIDPKTGDVLAMVGSPDYFADPLPIGCVPGVSCRLDPNVNAALRLRQPGSSFKPFVYATAFQKGYTPDTVLFDLFTEFNPQCPPDGSGPVPPCYHPGNYDETFRGPVTLRSAIAQSLNVPSVKLLYLAGINDSIDTAAALGITTLTEPDRYGLSLVLGGAEVKLIDMVSAYGVIAADGILSEPSPILKVETANGKVLEEKRNEPRPVLDPEIARIINDVLSDNEARIPTFQPRSSLYFDGRKVAAKTGTTQDYHDAWTIGYTPSIVAGVWTGNSNNVEMQQKGSGVLAAAPAWHEFMEFALSTRPPEDFPLPQGRDVQKPVLLGVWQGDTVVETDTISGKRATEFTPPQTRKFVAFGVPRDPLAWINRADPSGPPPSDPTQDPQYRNWQAAFERWLAGSGISIRPTSLIPAGYDDVHTAENQPVVRITPAESDADHLAFDIEITAKFPVTEAVAAVDGRIIASRANPEGRFRMQIERAALNGSGLIEIRVYDSVYNIGRVEVPIAS